MFRASGLFLACILAANGAVPQVSWLKLLGGEGSDRSIDVAVDREGNVYSTGSITGTNAWFGTHLAQGTDADIMYVAKFDRHGSNVWVATGGTRRAEGRGVAVDESGNVFVSGIFQFGSGTQRFGVTNFAGDLGGMFLAKFDADGVFQWVRQVGNSGTETFQPLRIVGTNIFVIGEVVPHLITSGVETVTNAAVFLAVFDFDGNLVSAHGLMEAPQRNALPSELVIADDGSAYIALSFSEQIAFFGGTNVARVSSSGDSVLTKWDQAGNLVWFRHLTAGVISVPFGLALAPNGDIILSGTVFGGGTFFDLPIQNGFVARVTAAGEIAWLKNLTTNGHVLGNAVSQGGDIFVTGSLPPGISPFSGSLVTNLSSRYIPFIASLNSEGSLVWVLPGVATSSTGSYSEGTRIIVDSRGAAYVCGMGDSLTLGDKAALGHGDWDILLARIAPGPPALQCKLVDGAFALSWPTNQVGYVLEACDRLGGAWHPAGAPAISGERYSHTRLMTNAMEVFRLVEE